MTIPPTFPAIAAQLQNVRMQIWNGVIPQGGLSCLLATNDFAINSAVRVDLTQQQEAGYLSNVQSIYMDASDCTGPVSLQGANAGGMNITLPGGWQGYFPFMQSNPPVFILSSGGAGTAKVYFVNAPLPPITWPTAGGTFPFDPSTGFLQVTDPMLDAIIANGGLNIQQFPIPVSAYTERVVDFATPGNNIIVPAVAAVRTRVYRLMIGPIGGASNIIIKSGATNLTGAMTFPAGGGFVLDQTSYAWFTGGLNEDLIISSSAAVQIGGRVYYTQQA